ncbi:MAG: sugar phosphate isomerase/epimerase [Phycisphaerales bacterium]|nr:MAG: sugar phosphate isomerase/epimerase [Phycisphaerales bacterium]
MNQNLNRRDFLKAVSVSGAAAVTSPAPSAWARRAGTDRKWRMRLSTSSIHFMGLPIEQACERIARLGFEAIDIWSAHQGCPHLDDVANRLGSEGLKKVLTKNKLKLFAFSVYKGGYERYAELLGKAGGGVAVRGSSGPCKPEELTVRMRKFLEGLKPLVELADKYDSYLAIENHGNALLCSQDSFKAFVDNNNSPRLGIALAPYHVQRQKESVTEAIRICGRQLFFFYAWQDYKGAGQLPGIGPTDMTPWMRALAQIGYHGYVNPFMHGEPEPDVMAANLAKSRDYLKECHKRAIGDA